MLGTQQFGESQFGGGSYYGEDEMESRNILNKSAYSGYLCFIEQYVKNKRDSYSPWKLPDGTLWD